MIPYGRLLPKSESPIRHFHRLVYDALASGRVSACANRSRRFRRP